MKVTGIMVCCLLVVVMVKAFPEPEIVREIRDGGEEAQPKELLERLLNAVKDKLDAASSEAEAAASKRDPYFSFGG